MREGARSIFVLGRTSSDLGRSFCKRLESVPKASVEITKILRAFAHARTRGPSVRLSARRQQHAADDACEVCKCVPCTRRGSGPFMRLRARVGAGRPRGEAVAGRLLGYQGGSFACLGAWYGQ